jgi:hypothetical protein
LPTLINNSHLNADISGVSLRPNRVVGVDPKDVPGGQNRDLWFNLAAFRVPGQYELGTASRGSLRGPSYVSTDLSLGKRFAITERKSLQLRWETFNTFNRTNMANPNTSIDAGPNSAGRITGLLVGSTMRAMQVGMRFDF